MCGFVVLEVLTAVCDPRSHPFSCSRENGGGSPTLMCPRAMLHHSFFLRDAHTKHPTASHTSTMLLLQSCYLQCGDLGAHRLTTEGDPVTDLVGGVRSGDTSSSRSQQPSQQLPTTATSARCRRKEVEEREGHKRDKALRTQTADISPRIGDANDPRPEPGGDAELINKILRVRRLPPGAPLPLHACAPQ